MAGCVSAFRVDWTSSRPTRVADKVVVVVLDRDVGLGSESQEDE